LISNLKEMTLRIDSEPDVSDGVSF